MAGSRNLVRLFVSSTFRDMHAERDRLNSFVFPELKSRCRSRGVDFVGVDLRWGVTPQQIENVGAVDVVLNEVERCRPFFLGMIGDRYGWVGPPNPVPVDALEKVAAGLAAADGKRLSEAYRLDDTLAPPAYRLRADHDWVSAHARETAEAWQHAGVVDVGRSVTEREIACAVWEGPAAQARAVICLREPGIEEQPGFPARLRAEFADTDPVDRRRLADLRERLRGETDRVRLVEYQARYAGLRIDPYFLPDDLPPTDRVRLDDGILDPDELDVVGPELDRVLTERGTVALDGLDEWGKRVLEVLWEEIEPTLPRTAGTRRSESPDAERDRFIARLANDLIGREETLETIRAYLAGDDRKPLVVTGQPGSGKSSVLARVARDHEADRVLVAHFVGASPGSTDVLAVVRHLAEGIRGQCELALQVAEDPEELYHQLHAFVEAGAAQGPLTVVVDGLDQIEHSPGRSPFGWLPTRLPAGCRLVVSALAGPWLDHMTGHANVQPLSLPDLDEPDRRELIRRYLRERGKRLGDAQITRLLDTHRGEDAGLPLYLIVALEELTHFGMFESLDDRIEDLPPTTAALIQQVLERLEADHGAGATTTVLRALAASRSGLTEAEIIALASEHTPLRAIDWGYMYRALEAFLRPLDERDRSGLLDFSHDQVRLAAYRRYLGMEAPDDDPTVASIATHGQLAELFAEGRAPRSATWDDASSHGLSELPYHLTRAGRRDDLTGLLTSLSFLEAKTGRLGPHALLLDFDLSTGGDDAGPDAGTRSLSSIRRALRLSAQPLVTHPDELPSHLVRRLRSAEGVSDLMEQITRLDRCWIRPVRSTADLGGGRERTRLRGINMLHALALTPDGCTAVTGAERGSIEIWNLEAAVRRRYLPTDEGWMTHAVCHPDGRTAYVGASSGNVYRIDLLAGVVTSRLGTHKPDGLEPGAYFDSHATVIGLGVTSDGEALVSGHGDGVVRVWNTVDDRLLREIVVDFEQDSDDGSAPEGLAAMTLGPDDVILCVGPGLVLLGLEGQPLHRFTWDGPPANVVAASSTGLVATGHEAGTVRIWDRASRHLETTFSALGDHDSARITGMQFSSEGGRLYSVGTDRQLRVFQIPRGEEEVGFTAHSMAIYALALIEDGARVATCGKDALLKTWDLKAPGRGASKTFELDGNPHGSYVQAVGLSSDGATAVSGAPDGLHVWDRDRGLCTATMVGHESDDVLGVAVDPAADTVHSLGKDGTFRSWSLDSGRQMSQATVSEAGIGSTMALAPDGLTALVERNPTHSTSALAVFRPGRKRASHVIQLGEQSTSHIAISSSGATALTVSLGGVLAAVDLRAGDVRWRVDLETGVPIGTTKQEERDLRAARQRGGRARDFVVFSVLSADDTLGVLGFRGGAVEVWDLLGAKLLHRMESHEDLVVGASLSRNGELACTASWGVLQVWHTRTGEVAATYHGEYDWTSCALSADGTTVVVGDASGAVHFLAVEPAGGGPRP